MEEHRHRHAHQGNQDRQDHRENRQLALVAGTVFPGGRGDGELDLDDPLSVDGQQMAATLALVGMQVLVVGSCYVRYLKALAANSTPASP